VATMKEASPDGGLATFIRAYLSRSHRDDPATGCVIASLGPEIVRGSSQTRHAFTEAVQRYVGELADHVAGEDGGTSGREAEEDAMYVLLSGMAGALLMSRAVDDTAISDRILRAARTFYSQSFADSGENSAARPLS
jgi:TetR/AcrR family transcriptional regulator, transcriptional repressor for nem operon